MEPCLKLNSKLQKSENKIKIQSKPDLDQKVRLLQKSLDKFENPFQQHKTRIEEISNQMRKFKELLADLKETNHQVEQSLDLVYQSEFTDGSDQVYSALEQAKLQLSQSKERISELNQSAASLSSQRLVAGFTVTANARKINQAHNKLAKEVANGLSNFRGICELVNVFSLNAEEIEATLSNAEMILEDNGPTDMSSRIINSKLGEIQVGFVVFI